MLELLGGLLAGTVGLLVLVTEAARRDRQRQHRQRIMLTLLTGAGPAIARADPRELIAWTQWAESARRLFPDAVAAIERESGDRFPISRSVAERAHAGWTSEWLAWERRHDAEFTERERTLQADLEARDQASSPAGRARLAAVDDEKLQTYQQRYEEYVRVSNALAVLLKDTDR